MTFFSTSGQVDPIPTSTPSNAQKPLIPLLSRTSQTKAILQRQVMIYFALFASLYLNLFDCFLSRAASYEEPDTQNYSKKHRSEKWQKANIIWDRKKTEAVLWCLIKCQNTIWQNNSQVWTRAHIRNCSWRWSTYKRASQRKQVSKTAILYSFFISLDSRF